MMDVQDEDMGFCNNVPNIKLKDSKIISDESVLRSQDKNLLLMEVFPF